MLVIARYFSRAALLFMVMSRPSPQRPRPRKGPSSEMMRSSRLDASAMTTEITLPPEFPSNPPTRKKSKWILVFLVVGVIVACEWRYSEDMQEHIKSVNRDLLGPETSGTGLMGALRAMTTQADVSREIMETQEHVHTLKDQVLAWKIKRTVQQSSTVGEAIGQSIAVWQQTLADHHEGPATTAKPTAPVTPAVSTAPAPVTTPLGPIGNWQVDHDTNAVTGVVTTTAFLRVYDKRNIFIRQRGKRSPDCYITTGDFLETVDNMENRSSTVQYRVDGGKPVRQPWYLSDDNRALFYPGNCEPFIAKSRSAKRLAFEYKPAERIESAISFDVAGLPDAFDKVALAPQPKREPTRAVSLPRCADQDWKLPCRTD
jgi:hypothetical protein